MWQRTRKFRPEDNWHYCSKDYYKERTYTAMPVLQGTIYKRLVGKVYHELVVPVTDSSAIYAVKIRLSDIDIIRHRYRLLVYQSLILDSILPVKINQSHDRRPGDITCILLNIETDLSFDVAVDTGYPTVVTKSCHHTSFHRVTYRIFQHSGAFSRRHNESVLHNNHRFDCSRTVVLTGSSLTTGNYCRQNSGQNTKTENRTSFFPYTKSFVQL